MEGSFPTADRGVGREAFGTLIVAKNEDISKGQCCTWSKLLRRVSFIGGIIALKGMG